MQSSDNYRVSQAELTQNIANSWALLKANNHQGRIWQLFGLCCIISSRDIRKRGQFGIIHPHKPERRKHATRGKWNKPGNLIREQAANGFGESEERFPTFSHICLSPPGSVFSSTYVFDLILRICSPFFILLQVLWQLHLIFRSPVGDVHFLISSLGNVWKGGAMEHRWAGKSIRSGDLLLGFSGEASETTCNLLCHLPH